LSSRLLLQRVALGMQYLRTDPEQTR